MSKGIVMFAHNNPEIDYLRLAVANALLCQKNLELTSEQICIVTDEHSWDYAIESLGEELLNQAAQYILVEKDQDFKEKNIRTYKDTSHTAKRLSFYNCNRCDVYDLTPFDETIMIDADYLVLSSALNACWGHNNELMMNWEYNDVMSSRSFPALDRLHPLTIKMYWATVVYFRKNDFNEMFFDTIKYVRDNSEYYSDLYRAPKALYRNDYSFSIAAHILGGHCDESVPPLPVDLYKSFDIDDVYSANGTNEIMLLLEKQGQHGDFILTRWNGVDIHIMNKWAFNRISENILECLK